MLLNEEKKLNKEHYRIFALSWARWVFDFYCDTGGCLDLDIPRNQGNSH